MLCIVWDLPEIAQSSKNIIMLHVLDANYFPINWGLADIKKDFDSTQCKNHNYKAEGETVF